MGYNSKEKPITAPTCRYTSKMINCNCLQVHERPKLANTMHQKISRYFLMFPNDAIYCFRDIWRYKTLSPGCTFVQIHFLNDWSCFQWNCNFPRLQIEDRAIPIPWLCMSANKSPNPIHISRIFSRMAKSTKGENAKFKIILPVNESIWSLVQLQTRVLHPFHIPIAWALHG